MPDPPLDLLAEEDRTAVTRWLWALGMEPHELAAVPPLRILVETLACVEVVRTLSPPMTRDAAWAEAAGQLGLTGAPLRRWYRWQRQAVEMGQ
jgi:hypothetical protein